MEWSRIWMGPRAEEAAKELTEILGTEVQHDGEYVVVGMSREAFRVELMRHRLSKYLPYLSA